MEFVIYVKQTQKRSFIYSENALNIILRDNFNSTQSIKLHMKHIMLGFFCMLIKIHKRSSILFYICLNGN